MALLVGLIATSCVNNDLDNKIPQSNEVELWGGLKRTSKSYAAPTRGTASSTSGILDPTWDGALDIGVARLSKKEDSDLYPDFRSLGAPMAATLGEPDPANSYYRPIEFHNQAQFFPDAQNALRYVAWYPWEEPALPTPMLDEFGNTYWQDENGSLYFSDTYKTSVTIDITGDKDVLYGNVIEGTLSTGFPVMEFDHALCLYRIYAYSMTGGVDLGGEGSMPADQWGKIEVLTLESLPSQVELILPHGCLDEGSGHNPSPDEFTLNYTGSQDIDLHDESNNIFFEAPEHLPIGISEAVLVSKCIAAPPASGIMSIGVKTTTHSALQEVSIARNFKAGHAYDIILRFSDHGLINADVSVGKWQTYEEEINQEFGAEVYFDLSAYETANCYSISSANYAYAFNCTVKGNGVGDLLGLDASDIYFDPGWMEVVWEDIPTFDHDGDPSTPEIETFALKSNRPSEGNVLFDVFGYEDKDNKELPVEGNVLLGAFDKNPAEGGRLLWTWHIWITDKPQGLGCGGGYVLMDRNLGAIDTVPTAELNDPAEGLYYQWGRHVPLRIDYLDAGGSHVHGLISDSHMLTFEDFFPLNDPNTLYGSGSDDHGWLSTGSKIYPNHDHMWGDTSVAFETPRKTLLDPCPPGYFVTPHAFWEGIEEYEVPGSFQESVGVQINMGSNNFWLPCQCVINDEGILNTAFHGVALRTSTIDYAGHDDGEGHHHHTPYYLAYMSSKNAKVSSENSHGNYAIPVRCISEATDPVVIDLSQSQTANCYMVNGPGYYKFKANVRGNGVKEMWPYGGTQMLDISDGMSVDIQPAKVDLLWWQGDFSEMAAVDDANEIAELMCINIMYDGVLNKDGYTMFRIEKFHPGNAILAAYSNTGEILWTWHLWLTASQPRDINSGWRTLQDRALGATQAPNLEGATAVFYDHNGNPSTSNEALWATYGFYYQWGRKDPILGAPIGATSDAETTDGTTISTSPYWVKSYATGNWERKTTMPCESQVDINESVAAPLVFYKSAAGAGVVDSKIQDSSNAQNAQWFSYTFADGERNVALWGYAVKDYTQQGEDFSKTMYDPCPPGYRTAFHDVWKCDREVTSMYAGDDSGVGQTSWESNEQSYSGYGFVTVKRYFEKAWFPYSGLRYPKSGGYAGVGSYGYLNTGMPMNTQNTRTFVYSKDGAWSRQICGDGGWSGDSGQSLTASAHASAYAKPVRCMKE